MKTLIKLSHILPTDPVQSFDVLQEYNLFDFMDVGLTSDNDGRILSVYRTPEQAIDAFFREYNSMVKVPYPIQAEFIKKDGSRDARIVKSFWHLMKLCLLISNKTLSDRCKKYLIQRLRQK